MTITKTKQELEKWVEYCAIVKICHKRSLNHVNSPQHDFFWNFSVCGEIGKVGNNFAIFSENGEAICEFSATSVKIVKSFELLLK